MGGLPDLATAIGLGETWVKLLKSIVSLSTLHGRRRNFGEGRERRLVTVARVLVVDSDTRFRGDLARQLARAGFVPVDATDGEQALALVDEALPDAVVLDVDLEDAHGFEICRVLRDRFGDQLPVVLVSSNHVDVHDRIAALLIGADEYLAKPVNLDELLARLRRLLARTSAAPSDVSAAEVRNGLTPRELEVLELLVEGLSALDIAQRLVISPKTVSSHTQHLMAKLGVHSRAQVVARAYRDGLVGDLEVEGHGQAFADGGDGDLASLATHEADDPREKKRAG